MKKTLLSAVLIAVFVFPTRSLAQEKGSPATPTSKDVAEQPASAKTSVNPEDHFKALLTEASLTGRWAPLKEGQLGEEKSGDNYHIVSVTKDNGENWTVRAKMKYRDQELVIPIPVQIRFVGDTALMIVDNLSIPGGGTYSARLIFYENTYSGSWFGGSGRGGMLYGVIKHDKKVTPP